MKKKFFILPVFVAISFIISFGSFATPATSWKTEAGIAEQFISKHTYSTEITASQVRLLNLSDSLWDWSIFSDKKDTATIENKVFRAAIPIQDLDAISGPTVLLKDANPDKQPTTNAKEDLPVKNSTTSPAPVAEPEKRSQRVTENLRPFPVIM